MTTLALNDRLSPNVGATYVAAGGQTDYAADFPLIYNGGGLVTGLYVRVQRAGVTTILNFPADFSLVTITADTFTARLAVASLAGDLVQVYSSLPALRDRAHAPGGQIRTDTLEGDADSFQAQLQELRRDMGRAVSAPIGEAPTLLPAAGARANKTAIFDGAGNLVAGVGGAAALLGYTDVFASAAIHWGGLYWINSAAGVVTLTIDPLAGATDQSMIELFSGDYAAVHHVIVQTSGADQLVALGAVGTQAEIPVPATTWRIRKLAGQARLIQL